MTNRIIEEVREFTIRNVSKKLNIKGFDVLSIEHLSEDIKVRDKEVYDLLHQYIHNYEKYRLDWCHQNIIDRYKSEILLIDKLNQR